MAQKSIPCVIMRGGTSKGVFLHKKDLPSDVAEWDKIVLKIFGSPDPMQIDGLGGTHSTTSKVMIISRGDRAGVDVEYTFGQVAVDTPMIDWGGNCGNLTSAVGPFAVDERLVEAEEPITELVLYNTNTDKRIIARFPVKNGRFNPEGDYKIDGVPGTGSRIDTKFLNPEGAVTGSLLPTGNAVDKIDTGEEVVEGSIVDATTPVVFVRASDISLTGRELPHEINAKRDILDTLERIRSTAAEMAGIVEDWKEATRKSPGYPKVAFVAPSQDYVNSLGRRVGRDEVTFLARIMSMQKAHHAYAVTGAMCTGAAARIEGTVVNEVTVNPKEKEITLGHPKGTITVEVERGSKVGEHLIKSITIGRTARRLMDGTAYYGA